MTGDRYALVIAGPSAVGKTTVMDAIFASDSRFSYVRSTRTRPPRVGSADDGYIHIDDSGFMKIVASGGMLEYMEYAGYRYGTQQAELDRIFKSGKYPFLILDKNGILSLKSKKRDFTPVVVYIYDFLDTLEARLAERLMTGEPDEQKKNDYIYRTNRNAEDYAALSGDFGGCIDFFVRNVTVDGTVREIISAFDGVREGTPPPDGREALPRLAEEGRKKLADG